MPYVNSHFKKLFLETLLAINMNIMLLFCIVEFPKLIHTSGRSLFLKKRIKRKKKRKALI